MSNDFYAAPSDLAPATKARSSDINAISQAVGAAFEKLPGEQALKSGTVNYAVNTGTTGSAYKVQLAAAITAYTDGLEVKMRPAKDNTGACTLNVNGLGNIAIKRADGTDPQAGDILGVAPITLVYQESGNVFRLPAVVQSQIIQAAGASASAQASATAAAGSAATALKTLAVESVDPPDNPIDGQEWIDAATGRRFTFIEGQWAETYASQVVDQPTLVDQLRAQLASASGTSGIGFEDKLAPAFLKTLSDILNVVPVSVLRFIDPLKWSAIKARTSTTDTTAAFNTAINAGVVRLEVPDGAYNISDSIDARNRGALELLGHGLPSIIQQKANTPVVLAGGERFRLEGFMLTFGAMPAATDTNAVCVRGYNLYESILKRLYMLQMYTGIDQYQGLVNGAQNAFFSNRLEDLRIINFNGWAAKLVPFQGGNSGNRWDNIYINNRGNSANAAGSGVCQGGIWLQTAQNDVFNLLNIEWMRNAGPALVLNQAGNPIFNGLHFEGLNPTTAYNPLIDIPGGDKSCPTFNALTVVGCDWAGAVGQGLIRLDNQGTRVKVNGLQAYNNTTPANMQLLTNGGATCYGSILEVDNANVDTSFATDAYSPKVSAGAAVAGVEYPMQRWNQNIAKHSALVTDNAGGTNNVNSFISGTVATAAFDMMGLWDAANNRFNVKQSGNYECSVTVPSPAAGMVIYVQKNYTNVATISPTAGNAGQSVHLSLARGDNIGFYLASGSYTKTNVTFGISLAS